MFEAWTVGVDDRVVLFPGPDSKVVLCMDPLRIPHYRFNVQVPHGSQSKSLAGHPFRPAVAWRYGQL